jgi:hypothetical protein
VIEGKGEVGKSRQVICDRVVEKYFDLIFLFKKTSPVNLISSDLILKDLRSNLKFKNI